MDEVEELIPESALAALLYEHDPMCGGEDCKRTAAKLAPILNERLTKALTASPERLEACARALVARDFGENIDLDDWMSRDSFAKDYRDLARAAAIALGLKVIDHARKEEG